jgi:hypothetical protein
MPSGVHTLARPAGPHFYAACLALLLLVPRPGTAQGHVHESPASRGAVTELLLEGPHLILYHRGLLGLGDAQQASLHRLRRSLCEAEVEFVRQRDDGRARVVAAIADTTPVARVGSAVRTALTGMAAADAVWLTALVQSRRDALALLTQPQRAQLLVLREHWAREAAVMIEEATRPGQRGHPGMQIPIRIPGMVIGETTLLPYCETLHGPTLHLSIPPPR